MYSFGENDLQSVILTPCIKLQYLPITMITYENEKVPLPYDKPTIIRWQDIEKNYISGNNLSQISKTEHGF